MKTLCVLMILANLGNIITAFTMFGQDVGVFLKVLLGADLIIAGGIIYFLGKWMLNDNSAGRDGLVKGLMANIAQQLFFGILAILGSIYAADVAIATA